MCRDAMMISGPDCLARVAMPVRTSVWQSVITTSMTTTTYFGGAFGVD